ncbi:MAG: hypothetical protein IPK70_08700 [Flavobacteriales bacterium]|nr:hypothetical protein [Flavobacteriales bacterium]
MENTKDVENTAPKAPRKVYSLESVGLMMAQYRGIEYRTPNDPPRGCVTEGRDLGPAITELIREGKVCVMNQLMRLAIFPAAGGTSWRPLANPLRNERNAMIEVFRHQRGAQQYGTTYTRALRAWQAVVPYPPAPDPDNPDDLVVDHYYGLLAADADHAQLPEGAKVVPAKGRTDPENGYRRWIEEFVAEVELCAQRFSDNEELRVELQRLVDELNTFEPGTAEGRQFVEQWAGRAEGREGIAIMRTGKDRLIRRLGELMDEQAPEPIADGQTGPRITWRGDRGELAEVFHQLVVNGWIEEPPRGRASLARHLLAVFRDRDGNAFERSSMEKMMQPKAHRSVRGSWKFELSKRPDPEE